MGSGIKILLFSFIVLMGFSFCTPSPESINIADSQATFDSIAAVTADSIAAAAADSIVATVENDDDDQEEAAEEYKPISFDTALQASIHPFDKDKWKKNIKSLDYSEEHFEKKIKSDGTATAPYDFSGIVKIIIVVLVIGLLAFLIWRLVASPPSDGSSESEVSMIFSEDHPEKMGYTELDELLKNYLKEKNYRFAIRILYLITLKRFSETDLIHWNKEKTNRNYIFELAGKPVQQGFSKFTSFYDTAWYGEHHVNEQQFELVNKIAEQLLTQSKSSSAESI